MPIVIDIDKRGVACPVCVCDACGKPALFPTARMLFYADEVGRPGRQPVFYLSCSDACLHQLVRQHGESAECLDMAVALVAALSRSKVLGSDFVALRNTARLLQPT